MDELLKNDENMKIEEDIDSYLKKIDYYLNSILTFMEGIQSEVFILQSRLIEIKENLNLLKDDYDLCNKMLDETVEDREYLYNTLRQTILKMKECFLELEDIIVECDNMISENNKEEKEESSKKRNLIILNPVFRDIDLFKKDVCQIHIRKKMYSMLKTLKNDNVITSTPYVGVPNLITIYELRGITGKGAPRVFYQLINDNVIILLLGIEKTSKKNVFKEPLEGRVDKKNNDYHRLINAFIFANNNPDEKTPYDNLNITNKEYLEKLLEKYNEREEQFWNIFETECYSLEDKKQK